MQPGVERLREKRRAEGGIRDERGILCVFVFDRMRLALVRHLHESAVGGSVVGEIRIEA